jgi:hypothetical protein
MTERASVTHVPGHARALQRKPGPAGAGKGLPRRRSAPRRASSLRSSALRRYPRPRGSQADRVLPMSPDRSVTHVPGCTVSRLAHSQIMDTGDGLRGCLELVRDVDAIDPRRGEQERVLAPWVQVVEPQPILFVSSWWMPGRLSKVFEDRALGRMSWNGTTSEGVDPIDTLRKFELGPTRNPNIASTKHPSLARAGNSSDPEPLDSVVLKSSEAALVRIEDDVARPIEVEALLVGIE